MPCALPHFSPFVPQKRPTKPSEKYAPWRSSAAVFDSGFQPNARKSRVTRPSLPCMVLASGGIDSSACLSYYKGRGHPVTALFVDYSQPARIMEERAVSAICAALGVPLMISRVLGGHRTKGMLLGRNALLLDLALMTVKFDVGLVATGVHAGTRYPDCSVSFIRAVQSVYDHYTAGNVRVEAPFARWSKGELYSFALRQEIPMNLTYSCLTGQDPSCGSCESCQDLESLRAR